MNLEETYENQNKGRYRMIPGGMGRHRAVSGSWASCAVGLLVGSDSKYQRFVRDPFQLRRPPPQGMLTDGLRHGGRQAGGGIHSVARVPQLT